MNLKKKIAVLACTALLMLGLSVFAFAEEGAADTSTLGDLMTLLNPENVDYLRVFTILITTVITFVRMFFGALIGTGDRDMIGRLLQALKNLIPSGK